MARVNPAQLEEEAQKAVKRALKAQHIDAQAGHLPRRPIIMGIIAYPSLDAHGELEVHDLALEK